MRQAAFEQFNLRARQILAGQVLQVTQWSWILDHHGSEWYILTGQNHWQWRVQLLEGILTYQNDEEAGGRWGPPWQPPHHNDVEWQLTALGHWIRLDRARVPGVTRSSQISRLNRLSRLHLDLDPDRGSLEEEFFSRG